MTKNKVLESCVDYNILKDNLSSDILDKMEKIINHYLNYLTEYDDGEIDIIGDYKNNYGNGYILDWFEGLMTTQNLIKEIKDEGYLSWELEDFYN